MKRFCTIALSAIILIGYSSCSGFKQMNSKRDGDDVYYSLKDAKKERAAEKKRLEQAQKEKEQAEKQRQLDQKTSDARSKQGSNYYKEDFDYDDYYDYEYAARLRRFDHPVSNYGYYDNYYTNSYNYNQNPYYYGTSVYNGYNFWGPSYYAYNYNPSSFWYYNNGWGWGTGYSNGWGNSWGNYYDPWNPWGYNPYGYGYSGYNYYGGYNPYGYGYGCNNYGYGNNNNYNNYYYNSFDANSNYYGPRTSPSSSDGRVVGSGGPTFGERFEHAVATENHLENASRQEINNIVGVPAARPVSTSGLNARENTNPSNPNTYNPGTTDTRMNTSTSSPVNQGASQRGDVPAVPVFSNPGSSSTDPATLPRNSSSPSSPTYTPPTYSAPSSTPSSRPREESHVERSSTPSSAPSGGSSTPRGNGSSSSSPSPRPR